MKAFSIGEVVFFNKSGVVVTIVSKDGPKWTVEKKDGKRLEATSSGLTRLGPWGCLCQEFRHKMVGDGCSICNKDP